MSVGIVQAVASGIRAEGEKMETEPKVNDRVRVRRLPYDQPHQGEVGRVVLVFSPLVVVTFGNGHERQYILYELEPAG